MSYRGMWNDGNDGDRPAAGTPLSRQPSIFSLTFDEFQSTMGGMGIGKDFGSMNMDEFLKNLWNAEENQAMAVALGGVDGGAGVLQRQGSLSLPRTLSLKTVDEVWRHVMIDNVESAGGSDLQQKRQPTLGEITLEEFLVRAGVVREEPNPTVSTPVVNNSSNNNNGVYYGDLSASGNSNSAFAFNLPQVERSNVGVMPSSLPGNSDTNLAIPVAGATPYSAQLPLGANVDPGRQRRMTGGSVGIVDPAINNGLITGMIGLRTGAFAVAGAGPPAKQVTSDRPAKGKGDFSSLSPMLFGFNGAIRGRKSDGAVEKVVERRQRRMIKNRESAARSRARKQAYTMELEAELAILKEKNQELEKKQAKVLEMQKDQILELLNEKLGPKRSCLRRTYTGPW
ncbi:bZIP transcription factor TRAB1-like [Dendrobium catenatum]|uniref:ABSCISIC ACID-INSENSITIVE 5-like protein 5 n=1 Tax=Dendrobium catenatum TaxID=906689 RepID=A0A2I0X7V0_9ASPA|nr:bZIP transcription factor TRAB1-like [Dendrobium catenatum]XP_020672780.1 bZIP transcription factor TRAB1-like [Dendrobium catenatum]PKU83951.1 ABSCISIC ACID-INSENSITIVE 5-like protein 5 [Dendrobium catenatum]